MLRKLFVDRTDHSIIQLIRYGLVVGIAAPIDLGGYILLKSQLHVYYVLAATLSFSASLLINYLLSLAWVFTAKTGRQKHIDATIFATIGIVGLGLTDLIVLVFTGFVHLNYIVSKLIAFSIVFFWSFGARRYLFRQKTAEPATTTA
jgi:putative flippase GtrA